MILQEYFNSTNTTYKITKDITVEENLVIPEGSILDFCGGSFTTADGISITLNNTMIIDNGYSYIFNNADVIGSVTNSKILVNWFKSYDSEISSNTTDSKSTNGNLAVVTGKSIQKAFNLAKSSVLDRKEAKTVVLNTNEYNLTLLKSIEIPAYVNFDGGNSYINVVKMIEDSNTPLFTLNKDWETPFPNNNFLNFGNISLSSDSKTLVYIYSASSHLIHDIKIRGGKTFYEQANQYIDTKVFKNIELQTQREFSDEAISAFRNVDSDNFSAFTNECDIILIEGDSTILENIIGDGFGISMVTGTNAIIKSCINFRLITTAAQLLAIENCHIETGAIRINKGNVNIKNCYFYAGGVGQATETKKIMERIIVSHGVSLFENVIFGLKTLRENGATDFLVDYYSTVYFKNVYLSQGGGTEGSNSGFGITPVVKIAKADNPIDYNILHPQIFLNGKIKWGAPSGVYSFTIRNGESSPLQAFPIDNSAAATCTYKYKVIVNPNKPGVGAMTNFSNTCLPPTKAKPNKLVLLGTEGLWIRIFRFSSSNPTHYVDIPVMNCNVDGLNDYGDNLGVRGIGFISWKDTTTAEAPLNVQGVEIIYSFPNICRETVKLISFDSAPNEPTKEIVGSFSPGDRIIYATNPDVANSVKTNYIFYNNKSDNGRSIAVFKQKPNYWDFGETLNYESPYTNNNLAPGFATPYFDTKDRVLRYYGENKYKVVRAGIAFSDSGFTANESNNGLLYFGSNDSLYYNGKLGSLKLIKDGNILDVISRGYLHSLSTAERPSLNSSNAGYIYYDNTIKKVVLWDGSAWINLDGTAL